MIFQNIDTYDLDLPEEVMQYRLLEQKKKLFGQLVEKLETGKRYEIMLLERNYCGFDEFSMARECTLLVRDLTKRSDDDVASEQASQRQDPGGNGSKGNRNP